MPTKRWVLVENCISTWLMMITSSSVQRVVQNHDGHHNTARHFLTRPQKNFSVLKGSWPAHKSTFTCKSGVKKNSCHYKDLLQILCNLNKKGKTYFDSKIPNLQYLDHFFFSFFVFWSDPNMVQIFKMALNFTKLSKVIQTVSYVLKML